MLFPSVSQEEFDFSADWLVALKADMAQTIVFEGTGLNQHLRMTISYEDEDAYNKLDVGELVSFPKEFFMDEFDETDDMEG